MHKFNPSITIRDVDRKKTSFQPFHNFHQQLGKMWKPPRSMRNCLGGNPNTSTGTPMELDPGQPVFVKEVSGNIWKIATVDQPAAEPDSYWVRFPDNSILRRTRSMIKPRSQPSHFELQAEAQPWNFERKFSLHSSDSFNPMKGESMLPVTPMESVTPPATKDRDSKVGKSTDPISSTEAPQPTVSGITPSVSTPRHSTKRCSTSQIYTIEEITVMECSGNFHFICAGLCSAVIRTVSV